jgi:hypothetical protein
MRTTLSIDDDVAALLERIRKSKDVSFKALINEALRQGLKEINQPSKPTETYQTKSVSLGRCLVGTLDDISEAIALTEGEDFR